jgi:hypothetical protein
MSSSSPNQDKPEQIATKAPRHKGNLRLQFIFASWCLGGVNVLPRKAQKLQLSAEYLNFADINKSAGFNRGYRRR